MKIKKLYLKKDYLRIFCTLCMFFSCTKINTEPEILFYKNDNIQSFINFEINIGEIKEIPFKIVNKNTESIVDIKSNDSNIVNVISSNYGLIKGLKEGNSDLYLLYKDTKETKIVKFKVTVLSKENSDKNKIQNSISNKEKLEPTKEIKVLYDFEDKVIKMNLDSTYELKLQIPNNLDESKIELFSEDPSIAEITSRKGLIISSHERIGKTKLNLNYEKKLISIIELEIYGDTYEY